LAEVSFEGELVGIAGVDVFACLFFHDVVVEEDAGGVEDAGDSFLPE